MPTPPTPPTWHRDERGRTTRPLAGKVFHHSNNASMRHTEDGRMVVSGKQNEGTWGVAKARARQALERDEAAAAEAAGREPYPVTDEQVEAAASAHLVAGKVNARVRGTGVARPTIIDPA